MEPTGILYAAPVWVTFVVTLAIGLIALEIGLNLGRRRAEPEAEQGPVDTLTAGTVGLLAFLLAFAFSIAASRFDMRGDLIIAEAQATRGAYLYAKLLPSPQRERSRQMLQEYTTIRVEGVRDITKRQAAFVRSEAIRQELWDDVSQLTEAGSENVDLSNYGPALVALVSADQERVAKAPGRIPPLVWWALYCLAASAMLSLGYQLGLARSRRPIVSAIGILALSIVVTMIVDLDRAQAGLLRVSQQPLEDVLVQMRAEAP